MAEVFKLYNKYVYAGQKVPGEINPKRLAEVQDFYVKQGIVEKATPINELYTNEFVK
jgi:NitT/TauT family transport system substrate-binding protein